MQVRMRYLTVRWNKRPLGCSYNYSESLRPLINHGLYKQVQKDFVSLGWYKNTYEWNVIFSIEILILKYLWYFNIIPAMFSNWPLTLVVCHINRKYFSIKYAFKSHRPNIHLSLILLSHKILYWFYVSFGQNTYGLLRVYLFQLPEPRNILQLLC
jgi:hypothetical protein